MRSCSDGPEVLGFDGDRVRVAFAVDFSTREVMNCTATTKGITTEMVKGVIAEWTEYRFGMVKPKRHFSLW
jgi:hypothetical protein